ncbi:MAG TPA: hypothetical protein VK524_25670, partial [Polyangiaceae bacterium]|nr:hypothetical protein [Polyangiaceae bacterium]
VGAKRGIVVWDEVDTRAGRQLLRIASFSVENPSEVTPQRTLGSGATDQEMPQLVTRGSGFWLAWVASVPHPREGAGQAARIAAKTPQAAPAAVGSGEGANEELLDLGNRWIELVALDENAAPISTPQAVSARDRHALVFDLAATSDGGALLAWRDDDTTPGVESRIVQLARVGADGKILRSLIDDDDVGAGVPSLVTGGMADASAWLALESVAQETRLAALGPSGSVLDELGAEPAVGNADVLALREGRLLVGRPRGLATELFVLTCKPGAPKATPSTAGR